MKKANQDEALNRAVTKGDLDRVNQRIKAGVDLNAAGKGEVPALFVAITGGRLEIVQALVAAGADINLAAYPTRGSSVKSTPLCYAIAQKHKPIVEFLWQAGAQPVLDAAAQNSSRAYNAVTAKAEDWIGERRTKKFLEQSAAESRYWLDLVKKAAAAGVRPSEFSLWDAVSCSYREMVAVLLAAGANPNSAPYRTSVLVRSIEIGANDLTIALLTAGASVHRDKETRGIGMAEKSPLLTAIVYGNLTIIPELINAGADINDRETALIRLNSKGVHPLNPAMAEDNTPLMVAIRKGHIEIVKLLVERGADMTIEDKHGRTALAWALRLNLQEMAHLLRKAGANEPEFLEGSLSTAFLSAAQKGDAAKVAELLKRGAKPGEVVDDMKGTHFPLVSAARNGHLPVVELLLQHGVNPNSGTGVGRSVTALMAASRAGHLDIVETLLTHGSDLSLKDRDWEGGGETALHYAARGGHIKIIERLLKAGAKINGKAKESKTALCLAVEESRYESVKALLAAGADPNAGPSDFGPLNLASQNANEELVKLLLAHGASPLPPKRKWFFLPLEQAALGKSAKVIQLLLAAGAPVNAQDARGDTALRTAALEGDEACVNVLLQAGADPNLANHEGFAPLLAAIRGGNINVVKMLLAAGAHVTEEILEDRQARERTKIYALLTGAASMHPPTKSAKPKAVVTHDDSGEDEDETALPDFSSAANESAYKKICEEVKTLAGTTTTPLDDLAGGFSFDLKHQDTDKFLADHHDRFLQQGAYLFCCHRDHQKGRDKLALLPTHSWEDLIRAFQTNGANYDLSPKDIIIWLKKLSTEHPFIITGVGGDWLDGRFKTPVKDTRKLARQMYKFCPDIVDQGTGATSQLAKTLEKDTYFYFWWD